MTRYFLRIRQPFLDHILAGRKTLEIRVAYPHLASLQAGDVIHFNGRHAVNVVAVRRYSNFEELLDHEPAERISPGNGREQVLMALREIYPAEKERLGVLAIELGEPPGLQKDDDRETG